MIILDTNVLSELMRPRPADAVVAWTAAQSQRRLYTTAVTQAEILHGLMLLPAGKRRTAFELATQAMFAEDFDGRVLPFSSAAALPYATIAAQRRRAGRPISQFDAQIAAIARAEGATLATRNQSDFQGCEIDLINPWEH